MHTRRLLARRAADHLAALRAYNNRLASTLRRNGVTDRVGVEFERSGRMVDVPLDMAGIISLERGYARWARTSTVYRMHPDMMEALKTVAYDRFPARSVANLSHRNPMIVFPEPLPCLHSDGKPTELVAVLVLGLDDDEASGTRQCDTDSEHCTGLWLGMYSQRPGDPDRMSFCSIAIDLTGPWFDVEHELHRAARTQSNGTYSVEAHRLATQSKVRPALAALLYVTSKDMDHEPVEAKVKGGRKNTRQASAARGATHDVGYHLGPDMMAERRRYESQVRNPTGGTVRAHPRAAHYKLFHTGPGRTVPDRRFVRFAFVNGHRRDPGDTTPTIIGVTPPAPPQP